MRRPRAGLAALVAAGAVAAVLGAGCSDDDTSTAPLDERLTDDDLVAAFSYQPDHEVTGGTSCEVLTIAFVDESEGGPEEWRWEFSDGTSSTDANPTVDGAVEEATLTVTRGDESDSVTQPVVYAVC